MKKLKKEEKKQVTSDEIELLEESNQEKNKAETKEPKNFVQLSILIISIMVLLISLGGFIYLKSKEKNITEEVNTLENGIKDVEEKMNSDEEIKKEKTSEYENLKEELKDKFEELEIWENLEEKLEQALS